MNHSITVENREIPEIPRGAEPREPAAKRPPGDLWHYRLLVAIAVPLFLVHATVARVLRRCLHPLAAAPTGESLYSEARRMAGAVIPYVFMF